MYRSQTVSHSTVIALGRPRKSNLQERLEQIQEEAIHKMERVAQMYIKGIFDELCRRYPKRDIEIIFGNGTMIVTGFENTSASGNDGLLESYSIADRRYTERFNDDHPLIKLMRFIDDAVYPHSPVNHQLALNSLTKR